MAPQSTAGISNSKAAGWQDLGAGVLLVGATCLAYLPALAGGFIWNDRDYVTAPGLRSLSGLGRIWTQLGATEQYYPLLHSFFWVQCRLWGEQPLGYHLVTLLLHAGAAILFALILRRLAVPGAWLAALLFALHPVHVESVAWITEQKNTLSLVFYLGAALAYLRFDETRRPPAYATALGLFLLSLMCKTVTATLPAALLVVRWWKSGRLEWRRDLRPLLPWLVIGAAAGLFSSWVEQRYCGARGMDFDLPALARGLVAGRAIWFYLGRLVWPFDLNFIYERWTPDVAVWWQWLFPLGVLVLAAALWAVRRRTRAPLARAATAGLAAFLFFAGSLFPVLGFVNLYGALYSWVWDHWQYLPDLGPLALAAAALTRGWERTAARFRWTGPVLVTVLAVALGALTWSHCGMFRDDQTLYRATIERNPRCWMAYNNLGNVLFKIPGRLPEALVNFEAALRLKPDFAEAHFNRGNGLAKTPGRLPEAITEYETALRLRPNEPLAHISLGAALAQMPGRLPEAITQFQTALRLNPDDLEVHNNLGNALAQMPDRLPEAIAEYQAALRLKPDFADAHYNLGNALARMPGRLPEAIAEYQAALRLKPDDPETHANLGTVLSRVPGRLPEAVAEYQAALRLKPGFVEVHYNLGNILVRMPDRLPEAVAEYEAALRLQPDFANAHYNLGNLLLRMPDRRREALAHFEAELRLRPDFEPARQMVNALQAAPPQR